MASCECDDLRAAGVCDWVGAARACDGEAAERGHLSGRAGPSSLLVGALAVPYSTVGQPSIAACVALFVSRQRTAESVDEADREDFRVFTHEEGCSFR
jgi:hypothetical protein